MSIFPYPPGLAEAKYKVLPSADKDGWPSHVCGPFIFFPRFYYYKITVHWILFKIFLWKYKKSIWNLEKSYFKLLVSKSLIFRKLFDKFELFSFIES